MLGRWMSSEEITSYDFLKIGPNNFDQIFFSSVTIRTYLSPSLVIGKTPKVYHGSALKEDISQSQLNDFWNKFYWNVKISHPKSFSKSQIKKYYSSVIIA